MGNGVKKMANEKRLIDANALTEEYCEGCAPEIREMCKTDPVCASMMWVVEAPTVDAVEVVHGRWIDRTVWIGSFGQVKTECSVCGTIYPYKPGSRGDGKGGKFCEECGARMDGAK